jgi:hypothetical protein
MTDNMTDNGNAIRLPPMLEKQLRRFERRLFRLETFTAICGSLSVLLFSYGLLLYADRLIDTPVMVRGVLTGAALLACLLSGLGWLYHWHWRRRDNRALARLVQRNLGGLGDRLLGAVELASGHRPPAGMSPALCRAAVHQVAQEAARYDFDRAAPVRRPRMTGAALVLLVLLVLAPALGFPQAGRNALARWVRPLAAIERYTFVSLENLPPLLHVAHGETFEMACRLRPESRWKPAVARCRINGQARVTVPVHDGTAVLRLNGLTQEADVTIRVGDAVLRSRVVPLHRPELLRMTAVEVLPDYLQREPLVSRVGSGRPSFLAGSMVSLTGTVSRVLHSAAVQAETEFPLPVHSNQFVLAGMDAAALSNAYVFTWVDAFGLQGAAPYRFQSDLHTDSPPRVETRGVDRVVAILDDEVLSFMIRADDDYGVRESWVEWTASAGKQREISLPGGRQTLDAGAPDRMTSEADFSFSPAAKGIPEDAVVLLRAYAVDYLPGRTPVSSVVHEIHVLSRARHAELIRTKMDAMQAVIEELTREEERLLEANRDLAALSAEQLASAEAGEQLREHRQAELENARQAQEAAQQAWRLLEEALRNSSLEADALEKWAELAKSLGNLAGREMQAAAQAMGQAAAQSDQRPAGLDEAMRLQEQILEELRRLEQLANRTIENMIARNFVNRLLQVAASERAIRDRLAALLPKLAGAQPEDLPDEQRQAIEQMTSLHERTRDEAGTIQDDLPGFFNRTRLAPYDAIYQEMLQKQMKPSLQALSANISGNVTMAAIGAATEWDRQFSAWAASLKESQSKKGESGEEGEQLSAADIEVIFGLLHARQREESLRDQTRLAARQAGDEEKHAAAARRLAGVQEDIAEGVRGLAGRSGNPGLKKLVRAVIGEMEAATALLNRPRADAEVIAVQTVIIEMLSGSDDDGGSAGGSAGQAMQMMQTLGMALGKTPGSGYAGGSKDGVGGADGSGVKDGTAGDDRSVEKAGGAAAQDWPPEYRDALQEFFNMLENAL